MYRHLTPWLMCIALALGSAGCGGGSWSFEVVGTQRDPGAEGQIQVEQIEGGNRLVTVSLTHMTPPERLASGLTTFVMWFRDRRGQATKASLLEYDPDSRTARATATTPMSNFTVIITAERTSNVVGPSENVVFTQRVRAE